MTIAGMIVGPIGAETSGAGSNGVGNKPAEKPIAAAIGNATMIGAWVIVTRMSVVTIVASVKLFEGV
uniref:hypothetical protein n=1 Tax=Pseudomonas fluorescens TaxID=294 RepID=UPI00177D6B11|nr:hypothetical protein [Pseudomonas fluorescens]